MESGGVMNVELFPDIAPNTVDNFISLVQKGFYNGVVFHRVIKGFMLQGGDPDGTGMGGPGYGIKGEFRINGMKNDLVHERGVISMARSSHPDSAGSQFFLMHRNSPHLDGQYAGFGKMVDGFEELDRIADLPTNRQDRPLTEQKIVTMTVDPGDYAANEPVKNKNR
jgi:peptidyl-prolyl cis-trans isomerase B (cyclophilin B)